MPKQTQNTVYASITDTPAYLQMLGQTLGTYIAELQAKPVSQRTERQAAILACVTAHHSRLGCWSEACIAYCRER